MAVHTDEMVSGLCLRAWLTRSDVFHLAGSRSRWRKAGAIESCPSPGRRLAVRAHRWGTLRNDNRGRRWRRRAAAADTASEQNRGE